MINIKVTQSDLLFGRIFDKGWYQFKINKIEMRPKKAPKVGENIVVTLECQGPYDSQGPTAGAEATVFFSSVAWMKDLLEACGIDLKRAVAENADINLEALVGMSVDAYSEPGEYESRPNNQIGRYKKAGTATNR